MKLIDRLKSPIKPWQRKLIAGLWIAFGVMAAGMMVFFYMAYNGMVGYMPPVEELKNPHDRFASSDLFGRRRRAGTLLPQHRQPSVCRLRRDLSECDRRTYFNRGFTFRGSFGHRRQGFGPSGRKDPATRTAQRRRRLHHHTAACKAAVFAGVARSDEPCDAETYRMDDSDKARAVLFERRDHQNVSQPV